MATKIQQVAAMLAGLDKYELECLKSLVGQEIETRPTTGCKLLDLPAELRDLIYYHVAITCISESALRTRCGLHGANKQIRSEFLNLLHSNRVVAKMEILIPNPDIFQVNAGENRWVVMKSRELVKALVNGGNQATLCFPRPECGARKDAITSAKYLIARKESDMRRGCAPTYQPAIFGAVELAVEDDHNFAVFTINVSMIEKHGLKGEFPTEVFDGQ